MSAGSRQRVGLFSLAAPLDQPRQPDAQLVKQNDRAHHEHLIVKASPGVAGYAP